MSSVDDVFVVIGKILVKIGVGTMRYLNIESWSGLAYFVLGVIVVLLVLREIFWLSTGPRSPTEGMSADERYRWANLIDEEKPFDNNNNGGSP